MKKKKTFELRESTFLRNKLAFNRFRYLSSIRIAYLKLFPRMQKKKKTDLIFDIYSLKFSMRSYTIVTEHNSHGKENDNDSVWAVNL